MSATAWRSMRLEEQEQYVIRAGDAFPLLLAVAKAIEADREDVRSAVNGRTMEAFRYLDAAHPDWRDWQP